MLFASIDIGTNAARLLFSNVLTKNDRVFAQKISLIRVPLRLGDDVFSVKIIGEKKQSELIKTMAAFKLLLDVYKPEAYIACASSALREAENSKAIIDSVKTETGIDLHVITGLEEAEIITGADTTILSEHYKYKMFVDLGGGSCEISIVENGNIIKSKSFDIGAIRYVHGKMDEGVWKKLKKWLSEFEQDFDNIMIVGSGGNINKLSKMYGVKESRMMTRKELKHALAYISGFSVQDRIEILHIRPDRADVIVPACMIFIKIMKMIRAEKISVPGIGLADGLIYKVYKEYLEKF